MSKYHSVLILFLIVHFITDSLALKTNKVVDLRKRFDGDVVLQNEDAVIPISPTGKCHSSDWVPYKGEKCFKILNATHLTQSAAKEACKSDVIPGSSLVIINFEEEETFLRKLLIDSNNDFDNVWLGLERIQNSSTFEWPNGIVSSKMYSNWASGYPTGDLIKNCVELRSNNTYIKNSNISPQEPGLWYNVPCAKRNLVVCESHQQTAPYDVQLQLATAKMEIKNLKKVIDVMENKIEGHDQKLDEMDSKFTTIAKEIKIYVQKFSEKDEQIKTINEKIEQILLELSDKNEQIVDINGKIQQNEQKLSDQDEQIAALNSTVQKNVEKLNLNDQQITTLYGRADANTDSISKIKKFAITDIRLSDTETAKLYKGPGFPEKEGYFITAIINKNKNDFVDVAHRRKIEKMRDGQWSSF